MILMDTWTNQLEYELQDSWVDWCNWTKTLHLLQPAVTDLKTGGWLWYRGRLSSKGSKYKILTNWADLMTGLNLYQIGGDQSSKDRWQVLKMLKDHRSRIYFTDLWLEIRATKELRLGKRNSTTILWTGSSAIKILSSFLLVEETILLSLQTKEEEMLKTNELIGKIYTMI
jgi:hypothetical protein